MGDERVITVQIVNNGKQAALGTKLTLVDHMGARILPALYSDNYLTVLPGEPRVVEIRYPANLGTRATVRVRGWNVQATSARVIGRRERGLSIKSVSATLAAAGDHAGTDREVRHGGPAEKMQHDASPGNYVVRAQLPGHRGLRADARGGARGTRGVRDVLPGRRKTGRPSP